MKEFKLNPNMLLGVATAATQIEGGCENTNWYNWSKNGDKTKDNSSPIIANMHYKNYVEDIDLMKKMGFQTYRLSIEWARIEPTEGVFDEDAINHYKDEIQRLIDNGILPLVTLHHFSNPIWFENKGGFLNKESPEIFACFVEYVAAAFKGLVKEYCTINEPNVYAVNCYLFGEWLNEEKSIIKTCKCLTNLAKAHILAYKKIKEIDATTIVGFANHIQYFKPKNKYNPFYKFEAFLFSRYFNDAISKAMAYGKFIFPLGFVGHKKGKFYDFMGINYYQTNLVSHFKFAPDPKMPLNDLGWALEPEGIRIVCEKFHKQYKCPIYITENGTADKDDKFRAQYIYDHLFKIHDLDYVTRYYHWTFMDNREWKEGMSARFGLIAFDAKTLAKTPRNSGIFYSSIIKNRGVVQKDIEKFLEK